MVVFLWFCRKRINSIMLLKHTHTHTQALRVDAKFQYSFQNSAHPVYGLRPNWANVTKNNAQVVRNTVV